MKKPKKTRAQLEHKLMELEAQLASTYHFASATIGKTSTDYCMASGVLLRMNFLGGAEAIVPVVITDGLSRETIACLRADMARSYERATEFKPVMEEKKR